MASKEENRRQSLIIVILVILLLITSVFNAFSYFLDSDSKKTTSEVLTFGTLTGSGDIYEVGTRAEHIQAGRKPTKIEFLNAEDLLPGGTEVYTLKLSSNSTISSCLRVRVAFMLQLNANGTQYSEYTFTADGENWEQFIKMDIIGYNEESAKYESVVEDKVTSTLDKWTSSNNNGDYIYYNNILEAGKKDYFFDFRLTVNEKFGSRMEVSSDNKADEVADLINRSYKVVLYVETVQAKTVSGNCAWENDISLPTNWLETLGLRD